MIAHQNPWYSSKLRGKMNPHKLTRKSARMGRPPPLRIVAWSYFRLAALDLLRGKIRGRRPRTGELFQSGFTFFSRHTTFCQAIPESVRQEPPRLLQMLFVSLTQLMYGRWIDWRFVDRRGFGNSTNDCKDYSLFKALNRLSSTELCVLVNIKLSYTKCNSTLPFLCVTDLEGTFIHQ